MSKEKNRKSLKEALNKLPEQQVRTSLWENIDQQLNLQESLEALPTYTPSDTVWEGIEQQLDRPTKIITLLRRVAAAILLLGICTWALTPTSIDSNIQYSQETFEQQLLKVDWEQDGFNTDELAALCQQQQLACSTSQFKHLKEELTELDIAKETLVQAMNNYGKDALLIAQLKEVEIERSTVIRSIYESVL